MVCKIGRCGYFRDGGFVFLILSFGFVVYFVVFVVWLYFSFDQFFLYFLIFDGRGGNFCYLFCCARMKISENQFVFSKFIILIFRRVFGYRVVFMGGQMCFGFKEFCGCLRVRGFFQGGFFFRGSSFLVRDGFCYLLGWVFFCMIVFRV